MTDTFEFTLNNPLTEEQWDQIADVDFDNTNRIWFHTKHGKEVEFVKARHGKWIDDGQYDNFFPHHEWRCSECGEHVLEIGIPWFKYCPNCGARMAEE